MVHRYIVDDIEVTLEDQIDYSRETAKQPLLQEEWTVTLTLGEWVLLQASLRGAMLHSKSLPNGRPGMVRIVHDRVHEQLPIKKEVQG